MCVSLWDLHQPKYLGGKLFASSGPANREMLVQGMLALSMVKVKRSIRHKSFECFF